MVAAPADEAISKAGILPTAMDPITGFPTHLSNVDRWLAAADSALRTLSGTTRAARAYPATNDAAEAPLSGRDRRLSGALMRVNHVGEVCAQALYSAQGLASDDPAVRAALALAAREETDHLAWTQRRLDELRSRPSRLNPIWFGGAFALGWIAGRAGNSTSLGFVVETERQVEHHLDSHLLRLPLADQASRSIVAQMKDDEARHGQAAEAAGAARLPVPVRWAMRAAARVMTSTAHYI